LKVILGGELSIKMKRSYILLLSTISVLVGGVFIAQQVSADSDAELVKKLNNPIGNLISVPLQIDWDTDIGPEDADRTSYTLQPVVPIELNDKWNLISRTIMSVYVDAESPVAGGGDLTGSSDILQSFFFSPKAPTAAGWIWGAGPVLSIPVANEGLGSERFGLGPTAVVLKQENGWTYGALTNHVWSVDDSGNDPDVSNTFLQPFLVYSTKTNVTYVLNSESTYNWETEEWTIPINLKVGKLMKFGEQRVQFQAGYRHYIDTPTGGPGWGLTSQVTFLFPK
jgi:hypothetical protein